MAVHVINKNDLIRLVYASRANFPATTNNTVLSAEVAGILMQSRKNNPANGLVGALYFGDGCFFQCLEGPAEAVDGLYMRLHRDPRHTDLKVLSRVAIDRLTFAKWFMKFVPNASSVRDVLSKHGIYNFDPYSFNAAVITDMINLLVQGADLAVTEPKAELAMPNSDAAVIARRTQMVSYFALAIALIALGAAVFR